MSDERSSAYRRPPDEAPRRRWHLRTSRRHLAGRVAIATITLALPALFVLRLGRFAWAHPIVLLGLLLVGVPTVALVASHFQARDAEQIAGGEGPLLLYDDRIELPAARGDDGAAREVFRLRDTHLAVDQIRISFNFVVTTDAKIAFLVSGPRSRRLSSRLFANDDAFDAFVADVRRLQSGQPLPSSDDDRLLPA